MTTGNWIFGPDFRRTNPYQSLLNAGLKTTWSVAPGDTGDALRSAQSGKPTIFHLHWTSRLFKDCHTPAAHRATATDFLDRIKGVKDAGCRFLWTIHNALPHHCPFPDEEKAFRGELAKLADIIHLHDATAIKVVGSYYPLPAEKCVIAPHGHFIDTYRPRTFKRIGRRRMRFKPTDVVFGYVGQLRPSRGADSFIQAASSARAAAFIAGRPTAPAQPGDYKKLAHAAGIKCVEKFINDRQLADLLQVADWIVLPYRDILTSGGLILALSLARPVIVPDLPALQPWKDLPFVRFYRAGDDASLAETIASAQSDGRTLAQSLGAAAKAHVAQFNWAESSATLAAHAKKIFD